VTRAKSLMEHWISVVCKPDGQENITKMREIAYRFRGDERPRKPMLDICVGDWPSCVLLEKKVASIPRQKITLTALGVLKSSFEFHCP